jgi:hypothetical protein
VLLLASLRWVWLRFFGRREPPPELPAPSDTGEADVVPDAIEAMLEQVRLSVAGEADRGHHIDEKAGQLLGFVGILLTLAIALGSSALDPKALGSDLKLGGWFFIAAAGLFLVAALSGVLAQMPSAYYELDERALESFTERPRVSQPRWQVQGDIMAGLLKEPLKHGRVRNEQKAKWAKISSYALADGLMMLTALAVTLALHAMKVIS